MSYENGDTDCVNRMRGDASRQQVRGVDGGIGGVGGGGGGDGRNSPIVTSNGQQSPPQPTHPTNIDSSSSLYPPSSTNGTSSSILLPQGRTNSFSYSSILA